MKTRETKNMQPFQTHDALLIVDPQNDFFPTGALPVPEGDQIIPVLNVWISDAEKAGIPILVSRDWHPIDHCSFKAQGGIWPSHCIQNTPGAAFHIDLALPTNAIIINKAFTPTAEAYSAFEGELFSGESLSSYLKRQDIQRLWIGGLALDYCIRATVLGAIAEGFEVNLILSATRAIAETTAKEAMEIMKDKGVHFI